MVSEVERMKIERVPASGSCTRCQAALGLASVKVRGEWYCGMGCTEERPGAARPRVDEEALYPRPRRFFGKRRPKELKAV